MKLLRILRHPALVSLVGVIALALLLWFEGPLIAFAGHAPLDSSASRITLSALLFGAWALWWGVRAAKARIAGSQFVAGLVANALDPQRRAPDRDREAADADLAVLSARFEAALKTLRNVGRANDPHPRDHDEAHGARGASVSTSSSASPASLASRPRRWAAWLAAALRGRAPSLYELPWYMFVGAPGAGKTTALLHSGLRFPLAERLGAQAVGGVGGTRHCDWWFADDAVLLDTAGRFTTHDSHADADRGAWLGFLALLRKYRPRRPLNGVIAVVSATDLLQQDDAARRTHALAVRGRLAELNDRLGTRLPVYVVVTKSDMLAGFAEFFDDLGRDEREQVWGVTFPLSARDAPNAANPPNPGDAAAAADGRAPLQRFADEFRLLHRRLQDGVLQRMQQETDVRRRALIYTFPQQFGGLEAPLRRFLDDAFGDSRFDRAALLRGVYFTSGTQTGRPLDRMMSAMAATLGLRRDVLLADPMSGRAYFVKRLLRDVIFAEAALAGSHPHIERRRANLQRTAIVAIAALVVAGLIGMIASDRANRRFVDESRQQTAALEQRAQRVSAGDDPLAVLPLLDAARDLPGGAAARDAHDDHWPGFGLDQRDKLGREAQRVYQRLLRQTLLPIVVQRMEEQLRRGDANDAATQYETLRAYLMLGDAAHFDPAALRVWAMRIWEQGSLRHAGDAQRASLGAHLDALFARGTFDPNLPLDQRLVAQSRATLERVPLAQRIDARIEQQLAQLRLPPFSIAGAAGPNGQLVFVRKSGAPLTHGIDGAYTRAGYDAFVKLRDAALADLSKDDWVLGRDESQPDPASLGALRGALTQRYSDAAIRQWDGLLGDVGVVPFSAPDQGARVANLLGSAASPLRSLIEAAARETTFTAPPAQPGKLDALRQRFGGANDADAEAAPTPVDTHFQALHALSGAALDDVIRAFRDAAATLQAEDSARRQALPLPATGSLDRLKLLSQGAPAPLAAALQGVANNADTVQLQGQRAQLRALWASSVAPACQQALDGRYPLVRGASREAAPDDFARLLAPGGLIDDFFQKNLQSRIDTSGAVWKWRPEAKALGFPDDVPAQFQNAAALRDALFREGGHQVSIGFSAKVAALDPSVNRFVLDIDGQQLTATRDAPSATAAFQWPSGKGTGQAHVELDPPRAGAPHADGPWALFHLFDAVRVQQDGAPDHFKALFDGGRVTVELIANSANNPFRAGLMGRFRCPASL